MTQGLLTKGLTRIDRHLESAWRPGLVILAVFPFLIAVLHVLAAIGWLAPLPNELPDILVKYIGASVIALVLLRVGRLLKGKFLGMEVEFSDAETIAAASNKLTADVARLTNELNDLRKQIFPKPIEEQGAEDHASLPMPKLPRILYPADTQKGRFGGAAAAGGFVMSAAFSGGQKAKVVNVTVNVRRENNSDFSQKVHFFLDSTFPEQEIIVEPIDGMASVETLVFGGFTVGAWIEGTDILLELDLSREPRAPYVVRSL